MPRHETKQSSGTVNSDNTDTIKEWDTSPHLQPMWARDVQEKLPEIDARSRQFVRNGTINEKGNGLTLLLCPARAHAPSTVPCHIVLLIDP